MPEIKAFYREDRLIYMTGSLVAAGAQAPMRLSVIDKSPITIAEGYCYDNMGGYFPADLKRAGFDSVFIEGRAPWPVQLCVHDDEAGWDEETRLPKPSSCP